MLDMHENSPKSLRQNLLKQRTAFAAEQNYAQMQADLIDHLNQLLLEEGSSWQSVALYWPIQDEVDLRSTLLAWVKKAPQRTLALPFARPDKHLDFYQWLQGDQLIPSKHGVPEPDPDNAERPLSRPDCILIPCVGWSSSTIAGKKHYWRLGYGGGYFDRTLAELRKKNPKLVCIGIGFDWQELNDDQWSAQTHDEPLDMLLTESGLYS
ncbi:5-formyltetrahydrofolate cyclo-ligase [Polynucleobacter sp. AP-Kolm-20A-A1]|uniref:5-formyltetrahydrofolate cyclo-ligase n=1 Tax=Polynucleobacter sp. AP-Kolm-20A-A1 TaxID=2081041 RepID=UPI001BFE063C|nr:5-formyltetrahydrofolate cyclo-ligase [Polynucleobacter sp. AP-Kolm-20A-A1]QWE20564.1 5-formyltetrahydrofolate cyclo-ligase [Polynucleobacter sp. AP-Kolm-20A-A1]